MVVVVATESARRVRDLGALFVVPARGRLGSGCRSARCADAWPRHLERRPLVQGPTRAGRFVVHVTPPSPSHESRRTGAGVGVAGPGRDRHIVDRAHLLGGRTGLPLPGGAAL